MAINRIEIKDFLVFKDKFIHSLNLYASIAIVRGKFRDRVCNTEANKEKKLYVCNNTQKMCIFADELQKHIINGRIQ